MELQGASALVTGGASGLGAATARALAAAGAQVVVLDLDDAKGADVAKEIGGRYVRADVTDEEQVIAAVDAAARRGTVARARLLRGDRHGDAHDRARRVVRLRAPARRLHQGDRGEPGRDVQLHPARRERDEPQRAGRRRRARGGGRHRVDRRVRRADRSGGVQRAQGRDRRHDAAGGARPRGRRDPGDHDRAGSHRHADLRRVPRAGGVQGAAAARRAVPAPARHRAGVRVAGARGGHGTGT